MKFSAIVLLAGLVACSTPTVPKSHSPALSSTTLTDVATTTTPQPAIDAGTDQICPDDMVHVSGMFCTDVIQTCKKWLDKPGTKFARCAEFNQTICTGKKVHMDFCIDREEHHPPDSDMPSTNVRYDVASQECVQEGKKLCEENQWTFACEGEQMYPHTTGYVRPSDKCNFDKTHLTDEHGKFINQTMSINENLQCVSPFGVHNMNGNADEWVILEQAYVTKDATLWSGLKGGWWGGMRNRCRPVTKGHGLSYSDVQTGFRCCKETQ